MQLVATMLLSSKNLHPAIIALWTSLPSTCDFERNADSPNYHAVCVCMHSSTAQVLQAAGVAVDAPSIVYCNGGVASTLVLFALHQLGNSAVRNYDGSWNEWGNRDDTPVATGPAD